MESGPNTKPIVVADLMSDLRAVMSKEMTSVRRLNAILTILCEKLYMPTAVLYVMRPADVLEQSVMVGKSIKLPVFVRVGEGAVGSVALEKKTRLDTAKNAQYKSVLTLPLIRGNQVIGVLTLLSRKMVRLPPEIVEAVENVCMVLSEFLTDLNADKSSQALPNISGPETLEGTTLVGGFAFGEVLPHRRMELSAPILATHPAREQKRLALAFVRVQQVIERRLKRPTTPKEEKEIFETYHLFLNDTEWRAKIDSAIMSGLSAEAALQKTAEDALDKMRSISDPYLKERAHDFQDLTARLMRVLMKKGKNKKIVGSKILVADSLGAAELLDYDLKHIKGIILEDGSQTTHVVIVARAYRIPLLGGVKDATRRLLEGDPVALDCSAGRVYLHPSDDTADALKVRQNVMRKWQQLYARNLDKANVSKDGVAVNLMLNLGLPGNQDKLPPSDGVGLYRTELLFMTTKSLPDIHTQTEAYRRVLVQSKGKPVYFRTLDIGSDKVLPYFENHREENPAMGWRSIRMVLDRRALLRTQLRALIKAHAGKTMYIMFPMVTDVFEFLEAKRTLLLELKAMTARREKAPVDVKVGTMLEVPSLLFQLDRLLPLVDFVSIGTNDLAQFTFAADRGNALIANRYDVLSPVFLRILRHIIQTCAEYNVPCSVCGEMASRPLDALTLIGLGARRLSMSPEALGSVKTALRSLSVQPFVAYLESQLNSTQPSVRSALFSYLRDHQVLLGEV
ncbi:MAG: phosphoenolpyruvate--protein phosphotransferase [Alphaproteobacteria bacterium]|nr:phosphoenolpyruvate--protein phosphotransferase [Alphaproteobacteria bacterium]